MTAPTDHPPAIPPIGVRVTGVDDDGWAYTITVPLGLSPEQPTRCGGPES